MPIDLGYKPHLFQNNEHLKKKRFSVLVCHRRWGKTVYAIMCLIDAALRCNKPFPRFGYVAPYRNQAKNVVWQQYLKKYALLVPGTKVNETELEVTFPNGAVIRLFGADNADAMRGLYFDGAVLDEVADMKKEVWGEIVSPALSDRMGWVLFIGTPKGMNLFSELYNMALSNQKLWNVGFYPASMTVDNIPWITQEMLAVQRSVMSDAQYRQEFECDFGATCDNVLISFDSAYSASTRIIAEHDVKDQPLILGVDVARFGGDKSVICKRQGLLTHNFVVYNGLDNMVLADRVASVITQEKPDAVCIDAGRGEGVIDRLRQLRHVVHEVAFGSRAIDEKHYYNRRSEMWDSIKKYLDSGGCIPNDADLRRELVVPTYSYDAAGRIKLESKEEIKSRLGYSTDRADAFALTFSIKIGGTRSERSKSRGYSEFNKCNEVYKYPWEE